MKIISKSFSYIVAIMIVTAFIAGYIWRQETRPHILEIYIFDLNNSQAVFIRTPDDKRILINGGANSGIIREITKILPFYSRRIDTVIATDTVGKNVSGLIDVLNRYPVGRVVLPAITLKSLGISTTTDQIYSVFLDTVKEKGIPIANMKAGDRLSLNDSVFADVLFPILAESFKYSKTSSPELVLNISYGDNSVMLLNNVTPKIQKAIASTLTTPEPTLSVASLNGAERLMARGGNVSAMGVVNALMVFNNASPDNLTSELTDILKPKYLIYSKSLNSSSPKVANSKNNKLDPLFYVMNNRRFNIKEKGIIKIVSDGSLLKIEN